MRQSHKFLATLDNSFYRRYLQQMLMIVGFILFYLISEPVFANPFANNIPASGPNSCPADHRMYYIGRSAPTYSPIAAPRNLVWREGNQNRDKFTFDEGAAGNKIFYMQFTGIDLNNNQSNNQDYNRRNTPPFFGGITNATSNAINLVHDSPAVRNTNNTVRLSSNWPMSKIGFKIQDLDASRNTGASLAYIEQARALNNGKLSLAYTPPAFPFHDVSDDGSTITGIAGRNCSLNECNIDAAWGYTPANTEVVLEHGNTETYRNSPHAVGYSDFYYCLAPPRIVLQKVLTGARVQTTDQFSLQVTGNTAPTNNFTTTGSGSTIDNNNTATAVAVAPNTTYTIAESIIGGGDIRNYDATYSCSNATTQSATDLSSASGSTVYNSSNNTRSFTLSNLNYGDEITCTITNTPTAYTFSGIVFNDNGGLSGSPKNDLTNSFINTYKYFNGVFDNGESGIDGSALNNLKVRLTDCNSTDITGTTPQNVSDTGSYSFTVPASAVAGKSQICLIQEEPDPWSYSVDTTPNRLEVPINNSVYLYEDNNFGEVIAEQTALVLKKYQYVHQCDANLNYNNILDKDSPLNGFSINAPRQDEKVDPGQCIAYKIEAYNHGHITLTDIRITDILQKTPVESVFHLPNSSGIAASLRTTDNPTSGLVNIGDNGVIITEPFNLNNTTMTTTVSKRTLYFNTKYGN
ncbi:hypothetical protein [Psychrobacter celer]|uniref:prealbumin-like fold domain-containing protein n=1 Tax=Psychrobacter celer TaxID=306572 RepID=UPI002FE49040